MLKALKSEKRENLNVKLTHAERVAIRERAKKHAGGCVSKWVRYASTHFEPKKSELTKS